MTTEPLLALRQVGHSFGGLAVLRSVTFDVPEGGIVGLIGPNGSGKTTLFNIVSGYIRPLAGTVAYRGASIARNSIQQRGLAGLVRTFQTPQVFEQMTVLENIMVGCTKLTRTNMLQDLLRTPAARGQMQEIRRRAEAACERFRLGALSDLPAASLTAGQRRILEIARAVVGEPRLLLLDEPFSNLDVDTRERLAFELRDILKRTGHTAILVTHNQAEAFAIADRIGVMQHGRLAQWDTPYALHHAPASAFVADFVRRDALADERARALARGR